MAPTLPVPPDDPAVVLRFGGVEVDAGRHRLAVDGREVRVQRLVFNLLLALCQARGRVLSRDELFSQLWPDGAFRADESLSQLVFKLRSALGRYSHAVVTVRQVGVRLDAEVEQVLAAAPEVREATEAPEPPQLENSAPAAADGAGGPLPSELPAGGDAAIADPGHPLRRAPTSRVNRRVIAIATAVLATLAVLVGWVATRAFAPVVVSAGFGLDSESVQASSAQTVEMLQRAFEADADGNQAAARVLMETAHASDPRTPVPSMFLTYWYGGIGDAAAAEHWAAERDRRIGPTTPTYVALLARFLALPDAAVLERLKLESLLLESRPDAALIRLARAHHHLQRNERAAALEHLRRVDLRVAGRRRAPIVLGDLASLGDPASVEAALQSANDVLDEPGRAYALARLRVRQQRWAEARASFDRTMALARSEERPDLVRGSALHAAMMSAELGEFADARLRLERSIQALRDEHANRYAWQSVLVLATLPSVRADEARALLDRLAEEVPAGSRGGLCLDFELVSALLRMDAPQALRCETGGGDPYAWRGGLAIAAGLRAHLAGDLSGARAALARAESDGVRDTALAAYADLLAARIDGTRTQAPVPDPPYPAWHRWALRWRDAPPQSSQASPP